MCSRYNLNPPLAATVCGLAWLVEVVHGPRTEVASCSVPAPVHEIVTCPPDTVGALNIGTAVEVVLARNASSAFGFDVSLIKILVPSG